MTEWTETIAESDGYRVRLELDDSPEFPYNDGATPILRIGGDYYSHGDAEEMNKQAAEFGDAWDRLSHVARNNAHHREIFERYVRIFHGATKVQYWNEGVSNEYGYVAFDTAAWRESMGITDLEALEAEDLLSEVRSWATGDVYGYIVEKQLHYTKTYLEDPDYNEEDTEWVDVDDGACWGFYGHEWAEQAARQALEDVITLSRT